MNQQPQRKQGAVQRKTSAEIVNEAKNMLAGGGYIMRYIELWDCDRINFRRNFMFR